jgi:hypothetical protein
MADKSEVLNFLLGRRQTISLDSTFPIFADTGNVCATKTTRLDWPLLRLLTETTKVRSMTHGAPSIEARLLQHRRANSRFSVHFTGPQTRATPLTAFERPIRSPGCPLLAR